MAAWNPSSRRCSVVRDSNGIDVGNGTELSIDPMPGTVPAALDSDRVIAPVAGGIDAGASATLNSEQSNANAALRDDRRTSLDRNRFCDAP